MTPRQIELALKKQRLQMRSAVLREQLSRYATMARPAFAFADRGRATWRWLRRHPIIPVAISVALLVARPYAALRWAQRGFLAWQAVRKVRGALQIALSPKR